MISRKAIREFEASHPDSKPALDSWYKIAKLATWENLAETKADFPAADLVGRRTVFNEKGNTYRLIARINYKIQKVFVLYILIHSEYDKGNWK